MPSNDDPHPGAHETIGGCASSEPASGRVLHVAVLEHVARTISSRCPD